MQKRKNSNKAAFETHVSKENEEKNKNLEKTIFE